MNWQQILKDLKRHYKPLKCIAHEMNLRPKRVQEWARVGIESMDYELGVKLVELHQKHCNGAE